MTSVEWLLRLQQGLVSVTGTRELAIAQCRLKPPVTHWMDNLVLFESVPPIC